MNLVTVEFRRWRVPLLSATFAARILSVTFRLHRHNSFDLFRAQCALVKIGEDVSAHAHALVQAVRLQTVERLQFQSATFVVPLVVEHGTGEVGEGRLEVRRERHVFSESLLLGVPLISGKLKDKN